MEAQHQKEADNLKKEVARLTILLEQALRDKSGKATVAQPEPMLVNPFNPQNMGANKLIISFSNKEGLTCAAASHHL